MTKKKIKAIKVIIYLVGLIPILFVWKSDLLVFLGGISVSILIWAIGDRLLKLYIGITKRSL